MPGRYSEAVRQMRGRMANVGRQELAPLAEQRFAQDYIEQVKNQAEQAALMGAQTAEQRQQMEANRQFQLEMQQEQQKLQEEKIRRQEEAAEQGKWMDIIGSLGESGGGMLGSLMGSGGGKKEEEGIQLDSGAESGSTSGAAPDYSSIYGG